MSQCAIKQRFAQSHPDSRNISPRKASAAPRDLLNKEYLLIPSTQVVRSEYLGEPRVIGVTAGAKF
jgi:hypothetical protein